MNYQKTYILLPCHSLEDFPTHHEGEAAEGLLAGWTALWHPLLLSQTASLPQWQRADEPPDDCTDSLIVIPEVSRDQLATGFLARAESEAADVIIGETARNEIIERALSKTEATHQIPPNRVADFLALGYCYLQIELLTRQLRYTSNLDEVHFEKQVVAAAQSSATGDDETTQRLLQHCFDLLAEERDHYYAVDAFLIDLTLMAETTLGKSLQSELAAVGGTTNLLLSTGLLGILADQHPETLNEIRTQWKSGRLGIIAGDQEPWPWMTAESVLSGLRQNQDFFHSKLGDTPSVYGRHRFGLTTVLPMILAKLGFQGALHATFEEGKTPAGSQSKMMWEAPDGTTIDAISRNILDASRPETFLALAQKLGEAMDMEHVATLTFAHWPGRASCWYHDLQRISRFGQPLGRFITAESYFGDSAYPGHLESLRIEQYRSPFLAQSIRDGSSELLSRHVDYSRCQALLAQWRALVTMQAAWEVDHPKLPDFDSAARTSNGILEAEYDPQQADSWQEALSEAAKEFIAPLESDQAADGNWLINPSPHVRRTCVMLETDQVPSVEGPVYAAEAIGNQVAAVVDVPAMGFVRIEPSENSHSKRRSKEPLLAEDGFLRNEFLEAMIQESTGSLQSIRSYQGRNNRMSQQIAMKYADLKSAATDPQQGYTTMVADRSEITIASRVLGEIQSEGKLIDERGDPLAQFRQKYRVWRGSRLLHLELEIDPLREIEGDPWHQYLCARFAWSDESWLIYRCANDIRQRTESQRIETPTYIELNGVDDRTTIFPCGIPFHRRIGLRMLDSLLSMSGSTKRTFQLAIGIDVRHPWQQAQWLATPPLMHASKQAALPDHQSGWLFHLNAKHVSVTSWEPIIHENRCIGTQIRLLETSGRVAQVQLQCFRTLVAARGVDFQSVTQSECRVEGETCYLEIAGNEWIQAEMFWDEAGWEAHRTASNEIQESERDDHHD